MNWYEALIFGLVQGLTEFLPVSSDGHLEIVKFLFGGIEDGFLFSVAVHGATVLSIIAVFYREILTLARGVLRFEWNPETEYSLLIAVSMIPVAVVGLFFMKQVESLFVADMALTGSMLIVTGLFLLAGHFARGGNKTRISWAGAFIIGMAQAIAVLPGLSRSGATISTGLMLGYRREELAKFSFLMVIIPILGANVLKVFLTEQAAEQVPLFPLAVAFVTAFVSGYAACRWMISIVSKGKLWWFAAYCFITGLSLIFLF